MTRMPAKNTLNSAVLEPRSDGPAQLLWVATAALAFSFFLSSMAVPASADPAQLVLTQALSEDRPIAFPLHPLDDLLAVPDAVYHWERETTDQALAAAVTLGNDPDLERRNPFRKRNLDLFRTQRWVTVGQREMLVRLRVRAKARKAMSVEVKF